MSHEGLRIESIFEQSMVIDIGPKAIRGSCDNCDHGCDHGCDTGCDQACDTGCDHGPAQARRIPVEI